MVPSTSTSKNCNTMHHFSTIFQLCSTLQKSKWQYNKVFVCNETKQCVLLESTVKYYQVWSQIHLPVLTIHSLQVIPVYLKSIPPLLVDVVLFLFDKCNVSSFAHLIVLYQWLACLLLILYNTLYKKDLYWIFLVFVFFCSSRPLGLSPLSYKSCKLAGTLSAPPTCCFAFGSSIFTRHCDKGGPQISSDLHVVSTLPSCVCMDGWWQERRELLCNRKIPPAKLTHNGQPSALAGWESERTEKTQIENKELPDQQHML